MTCKQAAQKQTVSNEAGAKAAADAVTVKTATVENTTIEAVAKRSVLKAIYKNTALENSAPATAQKNLVILISGTGTNMFAVIKACKESRINACVRAVISSNPDALGLVKAANEGVKTYVCPLSQYASPAERDKEIMRIAAENNADYIVLAGYLGILTGEFIKAYPQRIVNIHPSLLPKFGGKGCYGINVHRMVIESKEAESGATVHFVDENVDTGKIILSRRLNVLENDTPETLQKRILTKIEPFLLIDALSGLCNN